MGDSGTRRRMLGRPRQGFGRFLVKLVVFFFLVMGIGFAVHFFTPQEKLDSWKAKAMEFLKPGAVLREYLPFEVPFLDRLAEETPNVATIEVGSGRPRTVKPLPSAAVTEPQPTRAAATIPLSAPRETAPEPQAVRERPDHFGPGLETVGRATIELFYQKESVEERSRFLVEPDRSLPAMRSYYQRYLGLPTLKSLAYRGPVRDTASGRWFGVFDAREMENEDVHRWCVMFNGDGNPRIDWGLYQQLQDESLSRFLTDPAAPRKAFRLLVRTGEQTPHLSNPWKEPAIDLLVQLPLANGPPKKISVPRSDLKKFGFDSQLAGNRSRIVGLELDWTDSETPPARRIPRVRKVTGWGAW